MVPPKASLQLAQPLGTAGTPAAGALHRVRRRVLAEPTQRPPSSLVGRAGWRGHGGAQCFVHGKLLLIIF